MAPPMAAMIFLFGAGPVPGIGPGTHSPNLVEPVGIAAYLLAAPTVVKRVFMPRKPWYLIPDS